MQLAYINQLAHSAIRLAGIKLNSTLEANGLYYQFRQLTNGKFLACTHIDVTVADFSETWDGSTTTCAMVSIHSTICAGTKMHRTILLDANHILEVHVQQNMY